MEKVLASEKNYMLDKLKKMVSAHAQLNLIIYIGVSFAAALSLFCVLLTLSCGISDGAQIGSCVLICIILLFLFIIFLREYRNDHARVFLLVAAPISFAFCFLMLPDAVPDEIWHIYHVFDIFSGGTNMVVPEVLRQSDLPDTYASLAHSISLSANYEDMFTVERDMSSYLTHLYLLPSIVCMAGKQLSINPFVLIYAARLVNTALFFVCGYSILRMIPFGKTLLLVYLFNPMMLQQQNSCSADALTNIFALLFIVYVLKLRFMDRVDLKQWLLLGVFLCGVVLSKYAYAPLAFLALILLPKIEGKQIKRGLLVGLGILAVLGAVYILFFYQGSGFKDTRDLLLDPLNCVLVLARTFYRYGAFMAQSFGGSLLGSLNIIVWYPAILLYYGLLLSTIFNSTGEKYSLSKREKVGISILAGIMLVLIVLAFRSWSIGVYGEYDAITGTQGRYFIPVVVMVLLAAINHRAFLKRPNCLIVYAVLSLLVLLCCLLAVGLFFL